VPTDESDTTSGSRRPMSKGRMVVLALLAIIVVDVLAFIIVPPGGPDADFNFPTDAINANFHLPAPLVMWGDPGNGEMVQFSPSIPDTILSSWIIMAAVLLLVFAVTRGRDPVPGRAQNVVEAVYEGMSNFAISLGGRKAERYVPLFAGLLLFILASNWSGLLPFFGRVDGLRAPTSDVNITLGLALVSFSVFHIEGVRNLGPRGYLAKFFPIGSFKAGIAAGIIAMFVGFIEFLLEFIKPVTLSMRLFGNIFGGETALGVITALTIAIIPVALVALEFLLNFVQALIFATLTLMFTLAAIEGHHGDEHEEHAEEPKAYPVPHPTAERSHPI
jgi:F-type H+-transporting ATPase subunit a